MVRKKKLKSGERIWDVCEMDGQKYLVIQIWEHGPWCGDECLVEGGCSGAFFQEDIDGGDIFDVFQHPKDFVLERDYQGNPLVIKKVEANE